jgi:hypothetical protein
MICILENSSANRFCWFAIVRADLQMTFDGLHSEMQIINRHLLV